MSWLHSLLHVRCDTKHWQGTKDEGRARVCVGSLVKRNGSVSSMDWSIPWGATTWGWAQEGGDEEVGRGTWWGPPNIRLTGMKFILEARSVHWHASLEVPWGSEYGWGEGRCRQPQTPWRPLWEATIRCRFGGSMSSDYQCRFRGSMADSVLE